VIAADVYAVSPHVGRGGWSWYTGSASWMYRAAIESILGFTLQGDSLKISPCIPNEWNDFEITYRRESTTYIIAVLNNQEASEIEMDNRKIDGDSIPLVGDGQIHNVRVKLAANRQDGMNI